jgi:transcriptional regulator with XRE-family HTH domain
MLCIRIKCAIPARVVERRDDLSRFRERLALLLRESGRTQSEFARQSGVDRSTLSQLLAPQNRRLPRVETLLAVARASNASVDWLLGLSHDGPARTDIVREQLALTRDELAPIDESLIGWYREAAGNKVRYVPSSLPDLLKTGPVIRHEVARYATTRPEQKMGTAAARLALARAPGSDVECCNSIQAIEGFARGEEIWASLDRRRRAEALDHMIELTEELYPMFRWFLYDSRQRYAAPVTVFGLQRVVLYLGQMYMVLTSEEHVLAFVRQFDDLIRAATVQPPDVPRLLRRLRAELA